MCTKDFELPPNFPGGKPYKVKAGSSIWFPDHAIQNDPQYFSNPHVFDPDRFFLKEVSTNHPAYFPFGVGPRICIGNRFALQEVKVVLFQLLLRCNFRISSKTRLPMEYQKPSFVLTAKGGFWLQMEPRENQNINGSVHEKKHK